MSLVSWNVAPIRHDKRAIRILTSMHWGSSGWRPEILQDPDAAYAIQAGYLYDDLDLDHDEVVARAIAAASILTPEAVGNAFLASLTTRRLELRSALGTYALAALLPNHGFVGDMSCRVCCAFEGIRHYDFSAQNFERYKWGGVRHEDPGYMWFDLSLFARTDRPTPTSSDIEVMRRILNVILAAPSGAKPKDLLVPLADVVRSNTWERRTLLQILSYAGIMEPAQKPGYAGGWVNCNAREEPPHAKNDWRYPLVWWRGGDGVNQSALSRYFPTLGLSLG